MSERSYESSKRGETAPNWVSVFSGAGIGLMVGSLIGMSLSPVVGIFIGAVGTGLAALLGLNDRHFSVAKSLRIGSFGLAVLIAAPTGIYVRDHALLSPTLGDLAQQLVDFDIGIKNRSDAVKLLIQAPQTDTESASEGGQETATTEKSEAAGKSAPVPTVVERRPVTSQNDNVLRAAVEFFRKQRSGVYSTKVALTSCGELKGAYDETLTPAEVIRNFKVEKNGWDELAEAVEGTFEGEDRKSLLFIARDTVCESKPDLDPAQCDQLRNSVKSGSASNLNEAFGAVEQLQPTLDRVRNQITEGSQTAALVQLQKVLCPDKG